MINWAVLGLGNIAGRFTKSLEFSDNGTLYAVASKNPAKREKYLEKYPDCTAYETYDQILEDQKVDAVYIALPPGLHKEWTIKALQHKKAVLCEKPAAVSEAELLEMTGAARQENGFFMEAMKAAFLPGIREIRQKLEAGTIGAVTRMTANFCSNPDADPSHRGCYYYEPVQGGTLLDMGPYPVAFFMKLLGCEPVKIESRIRFDENGVDHHVYATLTYPENVTAQLEVAFDEEKPREAVIYGTKGRIVIPYYYRAQSFTVMTDDGMETEYACPVEGDDMLGEIEEVHRCLSAGLTESPEFGYEDSLAMARILDSIRQGAKSIE